MCVWKSLFAVLLMAASAVSVAGELVVKAKDDGKGWIAENSFYRLGFTKRGSVDEIFFKGSGKGLKSVYLSHDALGKLRLYKDPETKGEIIKLDETKITLKFKMTFPKGPVGLSAEYAYTFFADKPVVELNVKLEKAVEVKLNCNLNDFLFLNSYFTDWSVGEPFKTNSIGRKKAVAPTDWKGGTQWLCLYNFEDAFGIITIGGRVKSFIYFYNPEKYYIRGCQVQLPEGGKTFVSRQYIYIGPSGNGKSVEKWAEKLKSAK